MVNVAGETPQRNYPDHHLLSFGGSLFGLETWSCNLRLVANATTDPGQNEEEAFLDDAAGDLTTWFTSTTAPISSAVTLEWAKFNKIAPDGRYANPWTSRYDFPAPFPKGSGGAYFPPQNTLACTLLTAQTRGLGYKGRIYIPIPAVEPSTSTGAMVEANATAYQNAFASLINNLNNAPGPDLASSGFDVHVVSGGSTKVGVEPVGVAHKVTGVTVGRVIDTQRRRRRSLPELYGAPSDIS